MLAQEFCWFDWDCWGEQLKAALNWVAEGLMKVIFGPVVDAVAAALGQILTTMATFWVNVDTPQPGDTIDWLQGKLWYFVLTAGTISVIIAGTRMAWERRGEPARELLKSLLTLVVVMGMAVSVVGLLTTAGDKFSECVIVSSITPALGDDPTPTDLKPPELDPNGWTCTTNENSGQDFGRNVLAMLFGTAAVGSPMGIIMVISLGLLAIVASLLQVMMMIVRNGMLILLLGVLPLAAAATNTEMGKAWFKRCVTWLTAFLLYKPVAALIYAAALRLASTDPLRPALEGDAQAAAEAIVAAVTGFVMMILALFALPALMKFMTPLVAATAGANMVPGILGGVAGMAAEKMAKSGAKGADAGGDGPSGAKNVPQTKSSSPGPSGSGSPGAQGAQGAAGAPGASGAASSGASAGASSGASATASAGASAGASAAAGAATAGIATVAIEAAKAVKQVGDSVKQGVEDAVSESGNSQAMDDGPSGSK